MFYVKRLHPTSAFYRGFFSLRFPTFFPGYSMLRQRVLFSTPSSTSPSLLPSPRAPSRRPPHTPRPRLLHPIRSAPRPVHRRPDPSVTPTAPHKFNQGMRRSGDIPAALTVLAVAMLLLGTRPSPAAGQADQAAAAARTPFYCAGNNGDSNDDYDSGNQNLWVHASTEAECTAGPRQALLAWSSLPLSTLACTVSAGERCACAHQPPPLATYRAPPPHTPHPTPPW